MMGCSTSYDELALKRHASVYIRDYKAIKILEQLVDQQEVAVEETLLMELAQRPMHHYSLRIVELKDEDTLRAIFHEIHILKKLELHNNIMGLFMAFRHRQYVALLQPPFIPLREKIDLLHRFKKSNGEIALLFGDPLLDRKWKDNTELRSKYLPQVGIFNRDAIIYVLRQILSGLNYLNAKNFIHTQICSSNVFINHYCIVKLGSFLHARHLGSPRWTFTGNPTRLPPEAFQDGPTQNWRVKPNFDTWGIGLFVLEMITGKRLHYTREEMKQLAREFIDGTQMPPTLAETDPRTVRDGQQMYDRDIDSFLATCFIVNPAQRPNPSKLLEHPFMARPISECKARINIGVEPLTSVKWDVKRSLRLEMLSVHTYDGGLKEDELMAQILNAIRLVRDATDVPLFGERVADDLRHGNYVAIDASLAFLQNDEDADWSRDVLNESTADGQTTPGGRRCPEQHRTPHPTGEQIMVPRSVGSRKLRQEERDCQRCEMVFYVRRGWSRQNRQLFVALQFARWLNRELISFPDLVRIVDELDDILLDHMPSGDDDHSPRPFSPYKQLGSSARTTPPDSVAFISGLRRSLLDPEASKDPETHKFNNIYVEVALSGKMLAKKLNKFNSLREGDPVQHPKGLVPLCVSATFYELNRRRLDLMEAVLMGERRVREWEFDPEQRFADSADPRTQLTTLLKERRRDPNAKVASDNDWEASNEARRTKIWGDYTRDFMYRFARYYVPHQLSEDAANKIYGTPHTLHPTPSKEPTSSAKNGEFAGGDELSSWMDELQISLLRTRSKQEQDRMAPSKAHDDVEMRQEAVRRWEHRRTTDQIRRMSAQLEVLTKGAGTGGLSQYDSPAAGGDNRTHSDD